MILSSCNLPGSSGFPTQTTDQNPVGSVVTMTLQVNPTQAQSITPTLNALTVAASPMPTPFPPNTPVWSYNYYTCEFADDGGTMTMELAWTDRSDSEEIYKVFRNEQEIATLEPNSTYYVDVAFVAAGETLSYYVQAFNTNWQASSSTITYGCQ